MNKWKSLTFATLLAVTTLVAPQGALAAPVTSAVFNNPTGTAADKALLQNKIVELIGTAPAGSRIRMAMYYADDATIPNALIAAHQRGVNVQVIFDGRETAEALWPSLTAELGTSLSAASWALACPAGRGCIGSRVLGSVDSINHNKFFLFSSTGGAANVVVQSSANLHNGRDGLGGWNNALILVGNTAAYDYYSGYFDDLKGRVVNNNYYDTRTPLQAGNSKIFFYPRQEQSGTSPYQNPAEDTIYTILSNVDCFGNSVVGTQDGTHRTIIRVAMSIFSRDYLAKKLWDLDAAGCYVEVVETYHPGSDLEVSAMKKLLAAAGSYHGPAVKYYCDTDSIWIHSKYFEIEGVYYDKPDRKIVWTGSHNWSTNSLRQADEAILQLEDSTVFDAYTANFRAIRDSATIRSVANGGSASC
ncbi:MAG: hypothetical protein HOV71_20265 [Hamadaea sp.]|nr:hypothetical protein [Hamadaea sp.]